MIPDSRRHPSRCRLPAPVLLLFALALHPPVARAQVGHDPHGSPYRDIRKGHTVTPIGGYFSGDGGQFGIAPHGGSLYGLRYEIRNGSAVQVGLGVARANLERLIVDPFVKLANRVSGPVEQRATFAELTLQLNLTGGKTWHRLAPFVGSGLGFTFSGTTPADTSGFEFRRKFYFAPSAGVRFFITDRVHLRTEARTIFWKITYPDTFQSEPVEEPGTPPDNSNAVITDGRVSEWTTSSWLQVGLGYSFSF